MKAVTSTLLLVLLVGCGGDSDSRTESKRGRPDSGTQSRRIAPPVVDTRKTERTIHVFVALCDNKSQGIVPVSKVLGNGDDPRNNLYWGAMYGTKTFLKRSGSWDVVIAVEDVTDSVLERVVLKHRSTGAYLVADAYRGNRIKDAVEAFLDAAAGNKPVVLEVDGVAIGTHGRANLVAYVGHNGLMDFDVPRPRRRRDSTSGPAAIVLACKSKPYFQATLTKLGCRPMLLTTGLMAPEAYTLAAALEAWLLGKDASGLRDSAAKAYHKYQKCGMRGARRLFHAE
ncbi:MAG: hypothetical protein QGH60_08315 [Phycisphaerae bacterium]|jgi:hypothetical protein|nr:hypothetical protein [Phycisphaerae bacterium]